MECTVYTAPESVTRSIRMQLWMPICRNAYNTNDRQCPVQRPSMDNKLTHRVLHTSCKYSQCLRRNSDINSNYRGWKNAYITAGGACLAQVFCYSNQYPLPFANLQFVRGEILQLCVREYFDQFDRTSVNRLTFKRRTVIEYCDYSRWEIHSHVIVFVCSFVCVSLSVDPLPQHTCADFRNITIALLLIMLASGYSLPASLHAVREF